MKKGGYSYNYRSSIDKIDTSKAAEVESPLLPAAKRKINGVAEVKATSFPLRMNTGQSYTLTACSRPPNKEHEFFLRGQNAFSLLSGVVFCHSYLPEVTLSRLQLSTQLISWVQGQQHRKHAPLQLVRILTPKVFIER